jgi:hypothetical protein
LIEIIAARNHPVGKDNHITTDNAWLNCLLGACAIASFIVALLSTTIKDEQTARTLKPLFIGLGCMLYLAQLIEAYFSQTYSLLWRSPTWENFHTFQQWFQELKKFRPVVTFSYEPDEEQRRILQTT